MHKAGRDWEKLAVRPSSATEPATGRDAARPKRLSGDKGSDADWLRDELKARGVRVCLPARNGRNRPAPHNRKLYKKRCRIENAFARLKAWRALAMCTTRCGDLLLSATALAAAGIFGLRW